MTMKLHINIEFNIELDKWQPVLDQNKQDLLLLTEKIIEKHSNYSNISEVELSVLLTNAINSQKLNAEFRAKDKPTNILSFPCYNILPSMVLENKIDDDYMYLGDIALCFEVVYEEALQKNISFRDHLMHLFVHGVLHLIGYNHTQEQEAEAMESLEIGILSQFGIKSPY